MSFSVRRLLFSWFSFWILVAGFSLWCLVPPMQVIKQGVFKTLRKNLRFGIDLVGGTYITLEVQTDKAVESEFLSKLHLITSRLKEAGKEQPVAKTASPQSLELTFSSLQAAHNAAEVIQAADKDECCLKTGVSGHGRA